MYTVVPALDMCTMHLNQSTRNHHLSIGQNKTAMLPNDQSNHACNDEMHLSSITRKLEPHR